MIRAVRVSSRSQPISSDANTPTCCRIQEVIMGKVKIRTLTRLSSLSR